MSNSTGSRVSESKPARHAPVVRRPSDHPGHEGRFGNVTRMVFHPTPEEPNAPIAGVITYKPGSGFPQHSHDFAQLWYVLEGECQFGDHRLRAGDMVHMADPHFEHEMRTQTGCTIVFMQYPGPTTGARPLYQGRFDDTVRMSGTAPDLER